MLKVNRLVVAGLASALVGLIVLVNAVQAEDSIWVTDFAAAQAKAKAEKKALLVDFTGSDWCPYCIQLRKEVFDLPAFKEEVTKQFVCVELDFPRKKELSDELKAQNQKLLKEYKIRGYPTILVLAADGKVMAHSGYRPGGPEKYTKHLAELLTTYASLAPMTAELVKAKDLARAKLLDRLIEANEKLGNEIDELEAWQKEIVALDKDNKAGLKSKYEFRAAMAEVAKLRRSGKSIEAKEALAKVLEIPGISGEQKQEVYLAQTNDVFREAGPTQAAKQLKKALAAAPESEQAESIKSSLERIAVMVKAEETAVKLRAELEKAEGAERLKILEPLVEAYAKLGNRMAGKDCAAEANKWMHEIVDLDKDDKAGLRQKYEFRVLYNDAVAEFRTKKLAEAVATLDKALALPKISPEEIEQAVFLQGNCFASEQKFEEALKCWKQGLEKAPTGRFAGMLRQMIQITEKRLENQKAAANEKEDSKEKASK